MQTVLERIESESGRLEVPDAARALLEQGRTESARVDPDLIPAKRHERMNTIREAAHAKAEAVVAEAIAADVARLDAQIGDLRAQARAVDWARRLPGVLTFLQGTRNVADVEGLLDDVLLGEDDATITTSFLTAIARFEDLGTPPRGNAVRNVVLEQAEQARALAQRLRQRLDAWRAAHPSHAATIRRLEQDKGRIPLKRKNDWDTYRRAFKLS